jgi:hypothetical protein
MSQRNHAAPARNVTDQQREAALRIKQTRDGCPTHRNAHCAVVTDHTQAYVLSKLNRSNESAWLMLSTMSSVFACGNVSNSVSSCGR